MSDAAVPTTLAVPQLVATNGPFPPRQGAGSGSPSFTLGMIQTFAGLYEAFGAPGASGQPVFIQTNTPLFAIYGTSFGGNGTTTFDLPDLHGRVAVGGGYPGQTGPGSLSMTWIIAASPGGPGSLLPFAGTIIAFGGTFAPDGWLVADGSMLQIEEYPQLFGAIGNTFGGDGESTFALPDLSGAAPVGLGPAVALGQAVPGDIPGLGLNYLIATAGIYPSKGGGVSGDFPADQPFIGQVVTYAGSQIPKGWVPCNGKQLAVGFYEALSKVIGNAYGGDGVSSFGVPDLAGRMIRGRAVLDR